MRILVPALSCLLLCATDVSAQSPMASGNGEAPIGAASGAAPLAVVSAKAPLAVIRKKTPAARFKTIELGLGYAYMSPTENQSKRPGLQGVDASFTIGFSRLGIKADVGYVRASNVLGTGQHSDVFSYLAGPVFHPTRHRNFNTYVHALAGGARVSGPIAANGGRILLGGWTTG